MIIEKPTFENGTYNTPCELFKDLKIGSICCVGHSELRTKACKYLVSYKEESTYYLPILKEHTQIVSEVTCNRPISQLSIFQNNND